MWPYYLRYGLLTVLTERNAYALCCLLSTPEIILNLLFIFYTVMYIKQVMLQQSKYIKLNLYRPPVIWTSDPFNEVIVLATRPRIDKEPNQERSFHYRCYYNSFFLLHEWYCLETCNLLLYVSYNIYDSVLYVSIGKYIHKCHYVIYYCLPSNILGPVVSLEGDILVSNSAVILNILFCVWFYFRKDHSLRYAIE